VIEKGVKKRLGPFVKVLMVAAIILLLLIPLFMIRGLLSERQALKIKAAEQIVEEVGDELMMAGPLLVLPYEYGEIPRRRAEIHVIPDNLTLRGRLEVEYRSLGIYRAPVFRAFIKGDGEFRARVSDLYPSDAVPLPEKNHFIVGIKHMKGIREISDLRWGTRPIEFLPEAENAAVGNGVNAVVGEISASDGIDAVYFSFDMEISGGSRADFVPLGRDTVLELSGDWPSPSFLENLLPSELDYSDKGFNANWRIPEVSRPIQAYWQLSEAKNIVDRLDSLGVKLLEPVDNYKKVERSNKYGLLFLMIPFAVFFLLESLARLRVHPMQYMMTGAANVVFYLLLLAISEHLGFDMAYLIASVAAVLLISIYTYSIVRGGDYAEFKENRPLLSVRMAHLAMPIILSIAYFWLWLTLSAEDYALLIGSSGVFAILSLIMLATRKVKWYRSSSSLAEPNSRE